MVFFFPAAAVIDHPRPRFAHHPLLDSLADSLYDGLLENFLPSEGGRPRCRRTRSQCEMKNKSANHPCYRRQRQVKKWIQRVVCPGFSPGEINVKVIDGKVVLHAQHIEGDSDNQSKYEVKRTISLPEDVDSTKLSCRYLYRHVVILEAPRIIKCQPAECSENLAADKNGEGVEEKKTADDKSSPTADTAKTENEAASATMSPPTSEEATITKDQQVLMDEDDVSTNCTDKDSEAQPLDVQDDTSSEETCLLSKYLDEEKAESDQQVHVVSTEKKVEEEEDNSDSDADDEIVNIMRFICNASDASKTGGDQPVCEKLAAESGEDEKRNLAKGKDPTSSENPDFFETRVHLKGYSPDEILVSRIGHNITIDAEHATVGEFFTGKESFHREVVLPDHVDPVKMKCFMEEDGDLLLKVPFKRQPETTEIPVLITAVE